MFIEHGCHCTKGMAVLDLVGLGKKIRSSNHRNVEGNFYNKLAAHVRGFGAVNESKVDSRDRELDAMDLRGHIALGIDCESEGCRGSPSRRYGFGE